MSARRRTGFGAILFGIASLGSGIACAQEAEAERLFREGTTALEEGRLPEAREALEASLELNPHPSSAFNLMMTLTDLDELLGASALCHRLLADDFGPLGERRVQVERLCEALWAEIPVVEIFAAGAPRIQLRIDGEASATMDDETSLTRQLDPGRHVVRVDAHEHAGEERALDLSRGERATLTLRVVSASDSKRRRIWMAAIIGGSVLLAGAAIGLGVGLARASDNGQEADRTVSTLRDGAVLRW